MASFEQHISGAVVSTGILLVPLYTTAYIDMPQAMALLAFGTLGGVLPDIDSEESKPIKISFNILSIFLPLVMLLTVVKDLSVTHILIMWLLSSIILQYGVFKLFIDMTTHRGIFHSIPMGFVFFFLAYIFIYEISANQIFATLCGFFLFFGYIVHLLLDELVSLNAFGLKVKNSFGTAFKLYDTKNLLGTISVYILIFFLYYLYPLDLKIVLEILEIINQIKL